MELLNYSTFTQGAEWRAYMYSVFTQDAKWSNKQFEWRVWIETFFVDEMVPKTTKYLHSPIVIL